MDKFVKYIIWIAVVIVILLLAFLLYKGCSDHTIPEPETRIVYDTSVVYKYNEVIKRDTVVKWYERVIYKEVPSKTVYVQKVDTAFIEKMKYEDVMLSVSKRGSELKIFALNQAGMLLKEYTYKVGDDFNASSAKDKLIIKTRKFYWTGIDMTAEGNINPADILKNDFYRNINYRISAETGISWYDDVSLKVGLERDFTSGVNSVKLKTTVKLLK